MGFLSLLSYMKNCIAETVLISFMYRSFIHPDVQVSDCHNYLLWNYLTV